MPLSEQQLYALTSLEWLFDPNARRTGRTTALAVAAISVACRNPRVIIPVSEDVFLIARGFALNDPRLRPFWTGWESGPHRALPLFRLDLPEPIQNWLPPEELLGELPEAMRPRPLPPRGEWVAGTGSWSEETLLQFRDDPQPLAGTFIKPDEINWLQQEPEEGPSALDRLLAEDD